MLCDSMNEIVCAVDHEADPENAEDHHGWHYVVGKEIKDAFLGEEPVLVVVDRVAKSRPEQNYNDSAKLLPDLADLKLDFANSEAQYTPAEEKTMEHKSLEDYVAEGGLAAESRTGIAHPHKG